MLPQGVALLAEGWGGGAPLDLSRTVAVVPTRQAGRRLRAGLAEFAATKDQAVFPPRVLLPDGLLGQEEGSGVATAAEAALAWVEVLRSIEPEEFRAVFPVEPPVRSFAWGLRLAKECLRLQATLAEAGLTIGDVASRAPEDFPEPERWTQLAGLARRQEKALARHGRREPQAARIAAAQAPAALGSADRIVVLGVPDPLPLALLALAAHARRGPVEVAVFAPESEAANFDGWGRPLAAAWAHRGAPFADFPGEVRLCADAAAQAGQLARLAAAYPAPDGVLALGLADPEIAPLTENALARAGCASFDPAGEPWRQSGFYHLLEALAAFSREASFAHVAALARQPAVLGWLRVRVGAAFDVASWLGGLDELWAQHLPADMARARRLAGEGPVGAALAQCAELRARLNRGEFAAAVAGVLRELFAGLPAEAAPAEFAAAAEAWREVLRSCAAAARLFPALSRAEWWEFSLEQFGRGRHERAKPAGALELQGWLELLWEDAPHLAVAGFNDGCVPEAVVGDVFLPESLRARLGLKTNGERFARDAYLLHALVASRRGAGRVDVLAGKVSAAGDPLKPSRLLLQCPDEELPARIAHLFRPLEAAATLPAWERAWRLRPRRVPPPARVSVTAFRAYLECPFRFYLRHVLAMEAVDAQKTELDASDFGRLCHAPLEKLKEAPWRDCTDEARLRDLLLETLEAVAAARFGRELTVPLVAQLESARQRLRRAAAVQVRERAAGWVVQDVERKFTLEIGGRTVVGKIDRLDRHETTGAWRVIDYKTSDTAQSPAEAHLGAPRRDGESPDWALAPADGRPRAWLDLQLPLYLHALPRLGIATDGRVACGYFNLPKAIGDTGLVLWDEWTPELQESALRCARGVLAAVRAEKFWPPNEAIRPERDAFAPLFHRGAAASVEWEGRP
ncbi:MAG: ATP-dependent nuclease subunit B [Opitutus sp.]|nr:ATP-dependent nuclease subunit B [Opitutus sp.]